MGLVCLLLCLAMLAGRDTAVHSDTPSASIEAQRAYGCRINISPRFPQSGDLITVTISGEWRNSCIPNRTSHDRIGRTIQAYAIADYPYDIVCLMMITPFEITESLGALPPGTYAVDAFTTDQTGDVVWGIEFCASRTLTVSISDPILLYLPFVLDNRLTLSYTSPSLARHTLQRRTPMAFEYARMRTDVRPDVYIGTDVLFGIGAGCSAGFACRPPAEWVSR